MTAGVCSRKMGCLVVGVRLMVGILGTDAELPPDKNSGELATDNPGVNERLGVNEGAGVNEGTGAGLGHWTLSSDIA